MRIGIDATCWTNWRGFGRFTRSLVQALAQCDQDDQLVLFFDRTYGECRDVPAAARPVVVRTAAKQTEAIGADSHRSIADLARMTIAVARQPLDVFFCPSIDSYFPIVGRAARVVMIHDVVPETLQAVALPDAAARRRRRMKVAVALRQAHAIATGSETTRRQIVDVLGVSPDRVSIIPYGVSDQFRPPASVDAVRTEVSQRLGVRAPYVLNVAGVGPHKNVPRLIEAFARLMARGQHPDLSLVFVGKRDDASGGARDVAEAIARNGWGERVRHIGFQPDADLARLYQACDAVVLPSLTEGFGLPALEAVCCGAPAAVTANSPLPSLLGDAVHAFDPLDVDDIARAIDRAVDDRRSAHRPLVRPETFSWIASAQQAMTVFRRAATLARAGRVA